VPSGAARPWMTAVVTNLFRNPDNPDDHAKRNQLVRVTDDIVERDPWFRRRVSGRGQSGAVYFEVVEP
jgi:hypothetical protein